MVWVFLAIWWLIGMTSFVYWYTKDYDLTIGELHHLFLTGILGPVAFILGWHIHGEPIQLIDTTKVLFKKRTK